jgi:HlyD family secretion protein
MKNKKSPRKKWIFIAVFIVIGVAVLVAGLKGGDDATEVTIKTVKRGDITAIVTATGKIQPEVEVVISSEVPGEIVELPVRDGDPIQKGDLLVRVNPDTLEAQVKQQEASLASIQAGNAQRRAEMLQAEMDARRIGDLFAKDFATQDDLEQARTRLEVAKAAHEASLFQIKRQEMELKEANDQLAKASIYSPITGTVVQLSSEIGDRVVGTGQFAGTEIMRVADLTNMEVQVDVSEGDIVNVAIGDKATIEVDALPKDPLEGIVTEIANSAQSSGERSQEQLTTFAVRIKLKDAGERLRPGMTATADIETDTVEDVVTAPLGSVVVRPKRELEKGADGDAEEEEDVVEESTGDNNGKKPEEDDRVRVVFIAQDNKAILTEVETGIADRDFIEIKSGLVEGDRIITGSYRALTRELKNESAIKEQEKKKKDNK